MFLKIIPNPHAAGQPTLSLLFEASPGQTYAIDAEKLYRQPSLLNAVSERSALKIHALDMMAYLILILGVIGSFFVIWWLWLPCVSLCTAMLSVNRKSAGEMARSAAMNSSSAFLHLHTIGALWLVRI
ncbi:MAG: hypothetical protein V3V03_02445 [Hyphomonadaceae bacterium]